MGQLDPFGTEITDNNISFFFFKKDKGIPRKYKQKPSDLY